MSDRVDFLFKTLTSDQLAEHQARSRRIDELLKQEGYDECDVSISIREAEEMERMVVDARISDGLEWILFNDEYFTPMVRGRLSDSGAEISIFKRLWPFTVIARWLK